MSTYLKKSRSQAEKAIAAYIEASKLLAQAEIQPLLAITPIHVRMGKLDSETGLFVLDEVDDIPLPSICVAVPKAERFIMGYAICDVHIVVCGGIDATDWGNWSTLNPKDSHESISGFVAALFDEQRRSEILAALNKPDGEDIRTVKDFRAFGFKFVDDSSQESERQWMDDLVLEFHCQPTDDVSG